MAKKDLPSFDNLDEEQDSPRQAALRRRREKLADKEDYPQHLREAKTETETIDLDSLAAETSKASGSFNPQKIPGTKFGMLLDALPVPTMLIDMSCNIVFANYASNRVGAASEPIRIGPFTDLVQDTSSAEKIRGFIAEVFSTRKTKVAEAMLRIGKSKIWGRVHLRSLRIGNFRSVLALVEDLTHEKRTMHLNRLDKVDLERHLSQREEELTASREELQKEIAKRELVEQKLKSILEAFESLAAVLREGKGPQAQADDLTRVTASLAEKIRQGDR